MIQAPVSAAPSLAKAKAREILAELRIDGPELLRCLKEICVERGAFVKEEPLEGAEARLVVSGNRGIITVCSKEQYPARTRFSIAHELGHFELHRHADALWSCGSGDMSATGGAAASPSGPAHRHSKTKEMIECEANEFAAELLMPEAFIQPELAKEPPSLARIKDLAARYQASLSAMSTRFVELTEEACAVVFTRAGFITHSFKSPLFERQRYWIPQGPLSAYSRAYEASFGKTLSPGMLPVEADAWFQVPPYLRGQKILEQSEYFKGADFGITLLWIQPGRLIRAN